MLSYTFIEVIYPSIFSSQPERFVEKSTFWPQILLKYSLFCDCLEHNFDDFNQFQLSMSRGSMVCKVPYRGLFSELTDDRITAELFF